MYNSKLMMLSVPGSTDADVTTCYSNGKNMSTYLRDADDVNSKQQCGQQTHSDFKEELSETMIKKCNDYKC